MKCISKDKLVNFIQVFILILSYVIGSFILKFTKLYLDDIGIIKTLNIVIYLYIFQLLTQIIKFFDIHFTLGSRINKKLDLMVFGKLFVINLFGFLMLSIVSIGFLLMSLFFSGIKYLFIIFMIIVLCFIYLIYTIKLCEIVDYKFSKYRIEYIKNNIKKFYDIITLNFILITVIVILFSFIFKLGAIGFVFIILLDFILSIMNKNYFYNSL